MTADRARDDDERPVFLDAAFDDEQRRSDDELDRYRQSLQGEPLRVARREAAAQLDADIRAHREHHWAAIAGTVVIAALLGLLFVSLLLGWVVIG